MKARSKKCRTNGKTPLHACFTEAQEKIPANPKGHHWHPSPPRAGQATRALAHLVDISWLHRQHWPCSSPGKWMSPSPLSEWGNCAFTKWDKWALQNSPPAYLHFNGRRSSAKQLGQEACRLCWGTCWCQRGHGQVEGVLDTPNKARPPPALLGFLH